MSQHNISKPLLDVLDMVAAQLSKATTDTAIIQALAMGLIAACNAKRADPVVLVQKIQADVRAMRKKGGDA